ncbi:MAG: RsmB/NOP family class I SAM-dependent RNA methyltransferase [Gemmiger sp.]|uniref:RsmB/NOP family class I SAM-dependent RNA methyltransferase n=1 Tax=Gemmiger sp. TaxID=2049027 RepID=UPI002E78DE5A|nr:RsmB/NOP family class I SAM-dependent RNA methyltransferase [Gemmiger sp.]MEE0800211.1 RsmB/NOP family class I SAM-dependent RNA methyltransferase [Gemmiger sp.]
MSFPALFEQRERRLLGDRFETLFSDPQGLPARGITVNTLRCTPERMAALADFPLQPSPFCRTSFLVQAPDWKPGRHPYHHAGAFYAQEPSAASPAALLEVRPGLRVADLCAAPGGKTSQLAAALNGEGWLLANEFVPARAEILRQNLERMGVTNAAVTNADTARLAEVLPGCFDRVLVDAPCSGEGMFRKEAAAVTQYEPALLARCAALGRDILDNAAALLAPGGILVYSTCTFAPDEDEGQVAAFLRRHPEFTLCDLSECGFGHPGESNRAGDENFPAAFCRRIWPADGGEGHFMAKLRKAEDAPAPELPRLRTEKPARLSRQTAAVWQEFCRSLFPDLADAAVEAVGEGIVLVPPALPPRTRALRLLRTGVPAGRVVKGRLEPSHALFMAYGDRCRNREELTLQDPRTAAWLRGEEIPAETAASGWCAVLVDGFPLGAGKVSGGRIKNHYPKALRNLQ